MQKTVLLFLCLFLFKFGFSQPSCIQVSCIPPNGSDARACALCGPVHEGNTTSGVPPVIWNDNPFPCGTIENNYFILVVADTTGNLSATVLASNCRNEEGVEMVIYDQNFNPVSNCFSSGGTNFPGTVNATDLIPGTDYWIMIDGYNGDLCEVLVSTTGAFLEGPPSPPEPIISAPENRLPCANSTLCYSIDSVAGATSYEWVIPSNSTIVSGGGLEDLEICIKYTDVGGGIIRVTPINKCFPGIPAIKPIVITGYSVASSLDTTICQGDILEVGGQNFISSTITEVAYWDTSITSCDSVLVMLNLVVSDLTAPEITCELDTFLNGVALSWTEPIGADGYEVLADGNIISTQGHSSYLYQFSPGQDSVRFKIAPYNSSRCNFERVEITCFPLSTTGNTEKLIDSNLSLFPNPTNDLIEIQTDFSIEKIGIFDLSGKLLFEDSDRKIDLSKCDAGVYFLKIKTSNGLAVEKVIKL